MLQCIPVAQGISVFDISRTCRPPTLTADGSRAPGLREVWHSPVAPRPSQAPRRLGLAQACPGQCDAVGR